MFTTTQNKKNSQEGLMNRSKSVFDTFGKLVSELDDVNSKMNDLEAAKRLDIEKIQNDIDSISKQRTANEKFAEKIKSFIS